MTAQVALSKKMPITSSFPELSSGPIDVQPYVSKELFEVERERIFKRLWLKVGLVEEVSNPGDYKVKRVAVANTSVILIRGKDSQIRAFHNTCTHRGNKLVDQDEDETLGSTRSHVFSCRFHAWTFNTDGSLRAAPKLDRFDIEDKACLALRSLHCDTWEGFIFINFSAKPDQSLTEYLGGIGEHFKGYPYAQATLTRRYTAVLNCNWKVAMHAFSESYHVPTIHAATLPSLCRLDHEEFRLFGPHSSSAIYVLGLEEAAPTPATGKFAEILRRSPRHKPHLDELPTTVNPARRDNLQFEFSVFFPNFLLHVGAGNGYAGITHFTHQFWPLDVDTTFWEGTNYFRPPATPSERVAMAHTYTLHRNGWLEDTSTMESTHESLRSGALEKLYLMDEEAMIRNSEMHWRRYMETP